MEIIELTVISDQYSPGSNDISIGNFTLERIEDSQVDIKISFVKPDSISVSMTSPEDLQVTFLEPWIFKDLETEIEMTKSEYTMVIPPQMSEALAAQVEAFNKAVDKPITYVSQLTLALNLTLAYGLKYMWSMFNILQFMIFMGQWKINVDPFAQTLLDQLQKLALFEFIDPKPIKDEIIGFLAEYNIISEIDAEE